MMFNSRNSAIWYSVIYYNNGSTLIFKIAYFCVTVLSESLSPSLYDINDCSIREYLLDL